MYIIVFHFLAQISKFLSILKREMEFSLPIARVFLWSTFLTMAFGQLTLIFEAFDLLRRHYWNADLSMCNKYI